MKKFFILIIMVLFLCVPNMSRAQYDFSGSSWSDTSGFLGENAIYISTWVGNNEKVGLNRADPRYEFDLSGDLSISGDATCDGSFYVDGVLDVSGDITLDYATFAEDITFDGSVFIIEDFEVSADTAVQLITVGGSMVTTGDATFDGAVVCTSTVGLSENVTFTMAADEYLRLDAATTPMTQTAGALDINIINGATGVAGIYMDLEAENTYANLYGMYINIDDDAAGGEETVHGIYIANPDGTASVTRGVTFANTIDDNLVSTVGAAGQFAVIDAATTQNTTTDGIIDIEFDSTADGAEVINIDVDVETSSDSATVSAIYIDLDDDTDETADIIGVKVYSADTTGASGTTVYGVYAEGVDCAIQADNGYVRVGTGSTPDVTPGDDDIYGEGTIEIDGAARFDGAVTCNSTVALSENVTFTMAADEYLLLDAATTKMTQTAGALDINFDSTADGSSGININMDVDTSSDSATVSAILIDLDDDTDQTADIIGVKVTSSDLTGASGTTVTGLYLSGLDCAMQADNGYVRIGTGSTPDVTPGDDDIYGEGTIEIDGAARFDGAVDCNGGVDVTSDLTTNTITVSGDATFDGSAYVGGGLDVTSDLTTNAITVSGDVSCDGTVSVNSLLIYEPSTAQVIDATSDAILANATMVVLNPDADYTTDVTPTIADGTIGQILYITCANGEANRVRLQDEDTLASSNLELGDTSRDVSGKDVLTLMYDGSDWIEVNYANN